ncbi:MAG: RND family transporter [Verrucomicrobia bacterium]|nr:MAG: RND family transporter [Verrucomicrobiota bacterium]
MAGTTKAFFERIIFAHRGAVITLFAILTAWMTWSAFHLKVDAGFSKQLPLKHEYIQTFLEYQDQFAGANRVAVALVAREGDIFTPGFFKILKELTDDIFFVPGIDRTSVTSIFTPNARFIEVVEDGFAGGNIVPADFQPTPEYLEIVRENIVKSGKVGQLVASDFTGALVVAQLLEIDPTTGEQLDYIEVAKHLESEIRAKIQDANADVHIGIHIIGFAKIIGDVSDGASGVALFFLISVLLTTLLVRFFSQSWKFTILAIACSTIAVIWQLGLLNLLGFGIDPMSILVPFLIFAIAVSHGVQMIRAYRAEIFLGHESVRAARNSFSQLLVPGGLALATDTIGFITLLWIDVGIISELAITASLGVAMIIATNLFLLPVLLSYVKLPPHNVEKLQSRGEHLRPLWNRLDRITNPGPSLAIIAVAVALFAFGLWKSQDVQIGDLDSGVPELRQDSRYNLDAAVITSKFSVGVDVLTVIVETVPDGCIEHDVMDMIARFGWHMANVEGVQSVLSIASVAKVINAGWNEGSLKWRMLPRAPQTLALSVTPIETSTGLLNADGSVLPVNIYLADHKAETIDRVIAAVDAFRAAHDSDRHRFRLATGNIGVMSATNQVVRAAQFPMLMWVFASIIVLCMLTFRSWRAAFCIVLPLMLVSVLSYALMAILGIGLKVYTLPVAALGVGIGVDYGIYLFSRLESRLKRGDYFEEALLNAYAMSGTAIVFTGVTLAASVSMWIFSELKFQADMGILLTFMFIVNMLGAIFLLPAIARWLYRHHKRKDPPEPLDGNPETG